jgi:hypothetical protein
LSKWNPEPLSHLDEQGADRFPQMDMLVGIKMAGIMAHETIEHLQLVGDFGTDGGVILQGDHTVHGNPFSRTEDLFAKIDM